MIASGPFRGLFLFLGAAEFLHLIATRGASPQGPEKRLEFCEISHERGARSPANAPRDRTPPTPGTPRVGGGAAAQPPAGRRGGRAGLPGHTPGGAATPGRRGGTATSGRGGLPRATTRALYGARAGRLPPAATCPGGAATGQNRPLSGPHGAAGGAATVRGGYPRRRIPPVPGRLPGGPGPGGGLPRGGAAAQLPRAGATPGGYPGAAGGAMQRAVTGMRRHRGAGGYQNRACRARRGEKGPRGRARRAKTTCARLSRAYKEALFLGRPRGYFLDKTS